MMVSPGEARRLKVVRKLPVRETKAVVEKKTHFFINLVLAVFCLGVFTRSGNVFAEESGPADSGGTGLFSDTGENSLGSFTGCNSLFWLSAIAATFVFSSQGFDRNVHDYFAGGDEHETFISAAPAVGFFMPILLGAGLYFSGSAEEESKPYVAGCAVLQASFLALVSTSALKAVTGRPPPSPDEDRSREFRFGLFRGGIFWGWPSGHMATNTAAVTSLLEVYDDSTGLKALGGLYLAWLFFGVVSHGGGTMHWFSDAIAGTLVGYAIGSTVGESFGRRKGAGKKTVGPEVKPLFSPLYVGMSVAY